MSPPPTIVVHGGARASLTTVPADVEDLPWKEGIQQAARAGYVYLVGETSSAIDAVQAAVCYMEDCPVFNAGKGSSLTMEGTVEMDAVIMDGKNLQTGAVGCVKNIKNPVSLARLVMDKTKHILLVGDGANKFAKQMGVAEISEGDLITDERRKTLEEHPDFKTAVQSLYKDRYLDEKDHDTVGAVAIDAHGNVACATSTGGITAQMVGRVGDSPLIGGGAFCDNAVGAVSTTGHGEAIAKVTLARNITYYMEQGMSPMDAIDKGLTYMKDRLQSKAGAIAVSRNGEIGHCFNTEVMTWAWVQNGQLHYGRRPGEDLVVTL